MAKKWYESTVIKIEDHNETTKSFFVKVEQEEVLNFKAGQFVTMDLPISDMRTKRWRSYSIANHPDGSNMLEFCIVKLDGGAGTEYLFNEISVGSTLKFKDPAGMFYLPETEKRDIVFIGTGTGVAPFRSMLWDLHSNKKTHGKLHLIFGTRQEAGILYRKEFEEMTDKFPDFKYSVALSRATDLSKIKGEIKSGYLHQFYLEEYKEVREDIIFYICGWSNMIDEAVEKLILEMGYDKSQVRYELYG